MMSNCLRRAIALLTALFLASCGGGGSGAPTPPPVTTASVTYPTPSAYTINKAIASLTPTVTGTITAFTVSPALPQGLSLDATTGVISGTPFAVEAAATYTVTASSVSGNATAQLTIVVDDVAPSIAYTSAAYSFTKGVPAHVAAPTTGPGKILSWQVSPSLPAGLVLSTTDGSISGTPTAGVTVASYVITAGNSGGQATASLQLVVSSGPLIDLGHVASIQQIKFAGADVLTQDAIAHWVLWNYSAGTMLASGNNLNVSTDDAGFVTYTPLPLDLEGSSAVIQTAAGLEVRAVSDGHVLAEIGATLNWWKLASDGSYICAGNSSGLTVWSPSGAVLFSKSGDYSAAGVFATPTQIQLADGPNAGVVETINIASGTSELSATYQGAFSSWFADGSSFLTVTGSAVWIYSSAVVQEDSRTLPAFTSLGGVGGWFWTVQANNSSVNVYAVGSSATAAYTSTGPTYTAIQSGMSLAFLDMNGTGTFNVINLSGVTLSETSYSTSIPLLSGYGAGPGSAFLVGNSYGVLVDGASLSSTPRFLDYGQALSVAGSATDIVVATASGRILDYSTATGALEGTINFTSTNVALSSDGTILAAAADSQDISTDRTLNIYSLPSGSLTNSFPYTISASGNPPYLTGMTLSASGTVVAELLSANSTCDSQAVTTVGSGTVWCDDSGPSQIVALSPDGSLIAASPPDPNQSADDVTAPLTQPAAYIYKNGALSSSIIGRTLGWLDNSRLLVSVFTNATPVGFTYSQAAIYSATGQLMSSISVPYLYSIQVVNSTAVYSPALQGIYSLTDGSRLWASGSHITDGREDATIGAVSGPYIAFPVGNFVVAEPY